MCGVVGITGSQEASREAFLGLTTLQHRGQDAAGILTYDSEGFHHTKNLGLVESVFTRENMSHLSGDMAVGHARYSTVGRGDLVDVQPFIMNYPYGIGMVHNGNVVNYQELATELKTKWRRQLLTRSDTEVLHNLLAQGLSDQSSELSFDTICKALENLYAKVNGSFSVITLLADHGLLAFRDPFGLRPLTYGRKRMEDGSMATMVASETVALNFNDYEIERSLAPGEVLFVDRSGKVHTRVLKAKARKHCMFEWVYFASPESEIDQIPVYGTRIQLGKNLGSVVKQRLKDLGKEVDLIVPVPETSRIAAIALSEELQVPYREVLIKNRYIKRTFILDSQDKRQKAVNLKLSPVRSEIQGRRILLVDDSIVRGTTSKKLIELLRRAGAAEVIFVSTCPPIKHACYYGIDFPNSEELVAHGRDNDEIEKTLGADGVIYLDVPGLKQAIQSASRSTQEVDPCVACLTGQYPSDVSQGQRFAQTRHEDRRVKERRHESI